MADEKTATVDVGQDRPDDRSEQGSTRTSSEGNGKGSADPDAALLGDDVRPAAERALVRRLDMRLMPIVVLIFIMNYIDVSAL